MSSASVTYFTTHQPPFPDIIDNKIDTVSFLSAAKGVVGLVEKLGTVFKPIKYDMNGNIEKIRRRYDTDPKNHKYLHDMLLLEKNDGQNMAIEALQWLRRALHFFLRLFECIIEEVHENNESMYVALKTAYSDTLQMYHSWTSRQLFSLMSRMCPNRSTIVLVLALDDNSVEKEVIVKDMLIFSEKLKENVQNLCDFYLEHALEDTRKV